MGAQLGYDEHMAEFKGVPVTIEPPRSGEKYRTAQGFTAIKDGLRARGGPEPVARTGKPHWLKAPLAAGAGYDAVRRTVREHRLATVCEEAKCPNIGECWNGRTAATAVEALTPDFQGVRADVERVVDSGIEVFAQNIETVRRLTHPVRDPRAGYQQTLDVLAHAKAHRPGVLTKSSLMLGLGETDGEICECMDDLRAAGVDILTLGQYLRPTVHHLPVVRFVTPDEFARYRAAGLARGFRECVSGPLVRSSYRAERALAGNNVGLHEGRALRDS